jgi:hypothetical protein
VERVKLLAGAVLLAGLVQSSCADRTSRPSAGHFQIVKRSEMAASDADPLALVVEIGHDLKLRLNKIETGNMNDLKVLKEKLGVIFEDREQDGISARKVVVDLRVPIDRPALEVLAAQLAAADASPVIVIENGNN